MIEHYQEVLNECIDIQEHNKILHIFKQLNLIMKGGKQMGKHDLTNTFAEDLQRNLTLKDKEINDTKVYCAEQFLKIKELAEGNKYNSPNAVFNKIAEVADYNYYSLANDVYINSSNKNKIELHTTNQSNK